MWNKPALENTADNFRLEILVYAQEARNRIEFGGVNKGMKRMSVVQGLG